jgi:hypothetical protein
VDNPLITDDIYEESMIYLSHNQILDRFDKVCQSRIENGYLVPDEIRLQYLFFVANVASKSNISKDAQFYFSCMIELLNKSSLFLTFNKAILQRACKKRSMSIKKIDEKRHLYVSENALMELLDLCEPLEDEKIEQLLEKTQYTDFYHLRVKLLEKNEDYVTCLQLLVDGMKQNEYSQNREAIERTFDWI